MLERGFDRRGFLKLFGGAAAAAAAAPLIPFGRVWSFPSKIVIPEHIETVSLRMTAGIDWAFDPAGCVSVLDRWSYDPTTQQITREQLYRQPGERIYHRVLDQIPYGGGRIPFIVIKDEVTDSWRMLDAPPPPELKL